MKITRISPFSGKVNSMDLDITEDQIQAFTVGATVQTAFPNLSADEREFIKTGITPEEWESHFGSDE